MNLINEGCRGLQTRSVSFVRFTIRSGGEAHEPRYHRTVGARYQLTEQPEGDW